MEEHEVMTGTTMIRKKERMSKEAREKARKTEDRK
jgi:hypothetical protein